MEDDLQWKTTSNGRRTPYLSNHLLGHTHILNLSLDEEDDLQWRMTSNGRLDPMEDELQYKY